MKLEHKRIILAVGLGLFGVAFLVYYIFRASTDVIASDYVRLVYTYLDDVFDFKYLLSWESISRIPITFLFRIINVVCFKYSVYFDKIVGVFGLFIFNLGVILYLLNTLKSKIVKIIGSIFVTFISFSLISWEMILNGTGYAHFLTVGFMSIIFYMFDRLVKRTKVIMTLENLDSSDLRFYGNENENNRLTNMVSLIDTSQMQRKNLRAMFFIYLFTAITALAFAGQYAVSFLCTLIFFSVIEIFVFIAIRNKYNKGEIEYFDANSDLYAEYREQYNGQAIKGFGKFKGEKYSTVNNETTFKIFFKFLLLIIISLICLFCFFKSNNTGEPVVPVGFKDITLSELFANDIKFPIRFLLKSLASSVIGVETYSYAIDFKTIDENMIFFVGFIYLLVLILMLVCSLIRMVFTDKIRKNIFDLNEYRNVFPAMFIINGLASFLLVFLARYKFLRDDYGMSSRYAIQYMFLTIGVIIAFLLCIDDIVYYKKYFKKEEKHLNLSKTYLQKREKLIEEGKLKEDTKKLSILNIIGLFLCIGALSLFLIGHMTTTMDEIFKADYRKIIYENLEQIAVNYEDYTDDELTVAFEYKRNPEHIKYALKSLKKQKLNVFR